MKTFFVFLALAFALIACNATPPQPSRAFGILELSLNPNGTTTARLENRLNPLALTLRENIVAFGTGTTQVVSPTDSAHDYLVATFPVTVPVSLVTLQNLTLFALAKSGNIGGTAIKTITDFGGVTDTLEQARIAKHLVPVHAVGANGIDNSKADFQAFTSDQVKQATTISSSLLNTGDTILNYGFSARCASNCTANSRQISRSSPGSISIAIRVPKAAQNTTYGFVLNFVVLDDSESRVTRGVLQQETNANMQARATLTGATQSVEVGIGKTVPEVQTSSLGANLQSLGLGRIAAGDNHSCGLTALGDAYCWGNNRNGKLGATSTLDFSTLPILVGGNLKFASLDVGYNHTCAVSTTGLGYCWGENAYGQLGIGNDSNAVLPTPVKSPTSHPNLVFSSISAGQFFSCGLSLTGQLFCWGDASIFGTFHNLHVPNVFIAIDTTAEFKSVNAGTRHVCAVSFGNKGYCWGENTFGQLGTGNLSKRTVPVPVANTADGGVLDFVMISAAKDHTCGITVFGKAYCWGFGGTGELGSNTMSSHLPLAVLIPVQGLDFFYTSISLGRAHACVTTTVGAVLCWGRNDFGQLGVGNALVSAVYTSRPIFVASGSVLFSSIEVGHMYTCGLTTTGLAYCWGENTNGQLGNGTQDNSSLPTEVSRTHFGL